MVRTPGVPSASPTLLVMTTTSVAAPTSVAPPAAVETPLRTEPRLRLLRYEPEPGEDPPPSPPPVLVATPLAPGTDDSDPAVRRAAVHVLRVAVEVLDGRRPAAHLERHLTPRALRYWRAAAESRSRRDGASQILRLVLCRPSAATAEVAAVCRIGGRVRALAVRFEEATDAPAGWRVTVLRLG